MSVIQSGIESWRRRLYLPAYSIADAARYARTHPSTVSSWYDRVGQLGPALPGKERGTPLSYFQLVEVAFVAAFRHLGVSLRAIRKARDYLAQTFGAEFPFAESWFETEGRHVLLELQQVEQEAELSSLILADVAGQEGWAALVGERFAEFDYENGLALIWHLAGRQSPVLIDPRISFGAPSIRGIPTWVIKGRYEAGELLDDIVEDFHLEREQVRQALQFEGAEAEEDNRGRTSSHDKTTTIPA